MQPADKEALTIEPWAAGIALSTLLLVAAVAIFTASDRMRTPQLETVITPTAVGDTSYVNEPAASTGPIGLKYQGHNLDMLSESKIRDSKLLRVGSDDSGAYSIYRPEDEKDLPRDRYYMKVKPNVFMEVSPE